MPEPSAGARPRTAVPVAVIAAALALAPGAAAQEPPPVPATAKSAVEVTEVFFPESSARAFPESGAWLPVYLELKNRSSRTERVSIEGTVTAIVLDSGRTREAVQFRSRRTVEVGPGAPRRAWIYLRVGPSDAAQSARLEVKGAGGEILRKEGPWNLSQRGGRRQHYSLLVAWENTAGDAAPWTGDLSTIDGLDDVSDSVETSPARRLPDDVLGYQAFDTILIRDLGSSALEPAQVTALTAWVRLGGQVIFVPESAAPGALASELAKALGGEALGEMKSEQGYVPQTLFWFGSESRADPRAFPERKKIPYPPHLPLQLFDPVKGRAAEEVISAAVDGGNPLFQREARRLYAELRLGRGSTGFLTFNDQAHRTQETQEFLRAFWGKVVQRRLESGRSDFLLQAARTQAQAIVDALKEGAREIGEGVLIGLIGAYLFLVGPILYFALKKMGRLPWVIWVEPLLVVIYLGVIFVSAYVTKGVLTTTRQVTFISQREGEPWAVRESYLSIFAAAEEAFRVTAPSADLLLPLYKNAEEEQPLVLEEGPAGEPSVADHRLAHWQEGRFVGAQVLDMSGPGVAFRVEDAAGGGKKLVITNHLPFAIREGVLRGDGTECAVPAIAAGQTLEAAFQAPRAEDKTFSRHDVVRRNGLSPLAARSRPTFVALLERNEADFTIDRRTTQKERADYFVFYSK